MSKTKEQREQEALEKAQAKEEKRRANILAPAPIVEEKEEKVEAEDNIKEEVKEEIKENNEINIETLMEENKEYDAEKIVESIKEEIKKSIMGEPTDEIESKEENIIEEPEEKQIIAKKNVELPKAKIPVPDENKAVMKEFVYTLQDLINVAIKYNKGEIGIEDMNKFGQSMIIRDYLPLLDKMSIVTTILTGHLYSTVSIQEMRLAELYRNIFFYGLLEGYAMIDCKDRELITYDNYDLLYPIFGQFIKSYCKDDWEFFMGYIRDAINTYGLVNMMDTVSGIDVNSMRDVTRENKKLIEDLSKNSKLINDLREIAEMTDPLNKKIKEELRKIGVAQAKIKAKAKFDDAMESKVNDGENINDIVKLAIEKDKAKLDEERNQIREGLNNNFVDKDDEI